MSLKIVYRKLYIVPTLRDRKFLKHIIHIREYKEVASLN